MTIRVAINGYGRIGRNILRALYQPQSSYRHGNNIQICAINDLACFEAAAHLTQYDSVHGRFHHDVQLLDDHLLIDNDKIALLAEANPAALPWKKLNIDLVLECTGLFTQRDKAQAHIDAGAKKVIISAPAAGADATIVYGVNHQSLSKTHHIISNASCTTNCLAPLVKVLHEGVGIVNGNMTTIHAYTNDQYLTDELTGDLYRARAATQSIIPAKTGAATAIDLVLPELKGRLQGMAVRIPTINVSLVDLHFLASRDTSVEEINKLVETAAAGSLKGILACNSLPLVSIDFNKHPASSIFDSRQSCVNGRLVKVMAWYDNEWGFSNRMLDTARALMSVA